MISLLLVSLAAFWAWEFLSGLSPVNISIRLAPLLVAALALGITYLPARFLLAAASAGAVALWRRLAQAGKLPPLALPSRPARKTSPAPGTRGRAPDSQVGRRIPPL